MEIKVSVKVHEILRKAKLERCISAFMLGEDNNKVIKNAIRIFPTGGCSQMPSLSATEMNRVLMKIYKLNLIPCGIARTGDSISGDRNDIDRGRGRSNLFSMGKKAIFLTMDAERMYAEIKSRNTIKKVNCILVP